MLPEILKQSFNARVFSLKGRKSIHLVYIQIFRSLIKWKRCNNHSITRTGLPMEKEKQNKKKRIIIIAAIIALLAAVILILIFRSQIRATTMRILRMVGEISLEDGGKNKTVKENFRLNSGNALSTADESLVSIGLDDTKIVTLDELSRAEFNQAGRQLDLKLTDGSLFFDVQKPLDADEKMDIRTSTMVLGIRGTSGWISVEGVHESLIGTEGVVQM